ncbi:MAG: DEAD/DEAH box helicase [Microthrixaceae bacterium]
MKERIKKIKKIYDSAADVSISRQPISEWNKAEFQSWLDTLIDTKKEDPRWIHNNMDFVIALIMRAVVLSQFLDCKPRDSQLLALCLYMDAASQKQGRIAEIATGEGKTLIVAMFAITQCLLEYRVNIITSSSVLASNHATDTKSLYALFGLTVSNNCDVEASENIEERKNRYTHAIVYGDLTSFQRDKLLTDFFEQDIVSGRNNEILIVDEVDSLLLDKGDNTLYRCISAASTQGGSDRTGWCDTLDDTTRRCLRYDEHLQSVDRIRRTAVFDAPVRLKPCNSTQLAVLVANAVRAIVDDIDGFASTLGELGYANASGFAVSEIVYRPRRIRVAIDSRTAVTIDAKCVASMEPVSNRNVVFDIVSDRPYLRMGTAGTIDLQRAVDGRPLRKFVVHKGFGDGPTRSRGYQYAAHYLTQLTGMTVGKWSISTQSVRVVHPVFLFRRRVRRGLAPQRYR